MRHDLSIAGPAFRLRPVVDADADFILALRGNPALNRFLHSTSGRLSDQLDWLARYYERSGDYYFVVERLATSAPEGVISIYDVDPQASSGEWGRWLLRPGSLAAVESAWLIYRCAFEQLSLQEVYCRTVADNSQVVSFHDSCGITRRHPLAGHFDFDGRQVDAVEHRLDALAWREVAPRLEKLAGMAARRLNHG